MQTTNNHIDPSKDTIAVWFSCGAASAVAAYLTIEKYGSTHNVLIFNTPVLEEDEDNLRFKKDVEKWLGQSIIDARNTDLESDSAEQIWVKRKYMAGVSGAPCTMLLKKEARYQMELKYNIAWHVLGFTLEEQNRNDRFLAYERDNLLPVLIEAGMTKSDCFGFVEAAGIKLPRVYEVLDNANCIGCVKSTGVDYWQRIRKHYPDVFLKRCTLSRVIKCRLVRYKGKRIYLDELPIDATGRKSTLKAECGIFCHNPLVNNKPLRKHIPLLTKAA